MRVGNFSLRVPEGRECDSGHITLDHGRQYTLVLGNHCYDQRCDTQITVDGKDMGAFRVNAGCTLVLERPANDNARFTFFKAESSEGQAVAAGQVAVSDQGLIEVHFKPERRRVREKEIKTCGGIVTPQALGFSSLRSVECNAAASVPQNAQAGVTGLTGHSGQSFYNVTALDYDPTQEVVISVRLVSEGPLGPRPLKAVERSNAVPAPV